MRARKTSCKREILHSANQAPLLSRSCLIPSSKTKNNSQEKNLPEREIDFAALRDGTLVELIEHPADPNRTLLAVFKNGHVRFTDRLAIGGEILVPVPRTTPGFVDVKLPRGVLPYRSTRNLVLDIGVLIGYVIDMDPIDLITAACFVPYSWLADRLPTAVYLSVIGLPQSGKSALLELLSLICRRPLLVSDISEAAVRQACSFSPTLLIDEMDWKSSKATGALRQLLRAGTTRSLRALRIGGSSSSLGPKVFSSLEASPDSALNSRCLQLIIELQSQIVPLLQTLDREIRVDRASLLPAIVLEVLLARCHSTTGQYFPVTDLTGDVNTILRGRGEMLEVSPEDVGWTLRALGLHTDFIPRGRKGLKLLNDVRKKIHDLAAAYGVRTLRELPAKIDCQLCAALGLPRQLEANPAGRTVSPT